MDNKIAGLEKIISSDSTVLILGTFPSQESLRLRMYYANPRNQFWKIMGCLFDFNPNIEYSQCVDRLKEHKIALWDVLRGCTRDGSLDADINVNTIITNDFQSLFDKYLNLRAIFFNGKSKRKSSYALFNRYVIPHLPPESVKRLSFVPLPSSSSANTQTLEQKIVEWSIIQNHIAGPK
jgi:double-stranded uracil-DNA glycosylase